MFTLTPIAYVSKDLNFLNKSDNSADDNPPGYGLNKEINTRSPKQEGFSPKPLDETLDGVEPKL